MEKAGSHGAVREQKSNSHQATKVRQACMAFVWFGEGMVGGALVASSVMQISLPAFAMRYLTDHIRLPPGLQPLRERKSIVHNPISLDIGDGDLSVFTVTSAPTIREAYSPHDHRQSDSARGRGRAARGQGPIEQGNRTLIGDHRGHDQSSSKRHLPKARCRKSV
jgi:hypothetical protein